MKKKKHVLVAALAAFTLMGVAHTWMVPEPTNLYYGAVLTVSKDTSGNDDGTNIFDTKFFFPFPSNARLSDGAEHPRREALLALLATYERP